jgi:hypothetical protein
VLQWIVGVIGRLRDAENGRKTSVGKRRKLFLRPVVSRTEATEVPYSIVHVDVDGCIREVQPREKDYLESPFLPYDGGRPFVKPRYSWKNALDETQGFLRRKHVPSGAVVLPAPIVDPSPGPSREEVIESLRAMSDELIERDDGSVELIERLPSAMSRRETNQSPDNRPV